MGSHYGSSLTLKGKSMSLRFWSFISGKVPEVAHTLSFYPRGQNRAYFHSTGSGFEILTNFQNCLIWVWNVAIGKSSRSCTYTLFLPPGVEIELIFTLRVAVSEILAVFNIAIFGHETWLMAKVPEVANMLLSFYPSTSKLGLFLLYQQPFSI